MGPDELTKIKWGFNQNPFNVSAAELEERFKDIDPQSFFLEPPYFDRIVGDPENPASSIVYGYRGDGKSFICNTMRNKLLGKSYVFCWERIPGKDNERLIEFLLKKLGIDWAKAARIEKTYDGKTISISAEGNSISLKINDIKTEVTLEINDKLTINFIAKMDGNNINIYEKSIKILAVDYTSFTNFERADLEKISLEDHINVILALCIDRLAVEIENDSSLLNKLDWTKKESLDWFFNKYHPNESTLVEKKIKGIISFCKRQIDYILGKNISRRNLENLSNFDLLIQLRDLIRETGFRSIYIIVDKLDENGLRNFSYIDMSKFISPVLTSLNYLQLENVATKLFIPIQIRNVLGPNIRSDRIDTITIRWDNRRLWEMLEKRLNAFSEGEQNSLRPFVEPDLIDYFETNILFYSANNPRNLIRLIKEIISELCENDPDPMYISKLAINNGIRKFYDDRRAEADSDMYMDMLMKNAANFEGKELYDVPEHI